MLFCFAPVFKPHGTTGFVHRRVRALVGRDGGKLDVVTAKRVNRERGCFLRVGKEREEQENECLLHGEKRFLIQIIDRAAWVFVGQFRVGRAVKNAVVWRVSVGVGDGGLFEEVDRENIRYGAVVCGDGG